MLESLMLKVIMKFLLTGLDPLGLLHGRVNLGEILFKIRMWLSSISVSYPTNPKFRNNDQRKFQFT